MLDWLTDPFQADFTRRALAEVLVLGVACGPLGAWILLYRQSYAAESISHGMLPGLVLAALAGAPSASAVTRAWPSPSRVCSGSARCSRSRPTRRRASRSCCSATCSAPPP